MRHDELMLNFSFALGVGGQFRSACNLRCVAIGLAGGFLPNVALQPKASISCEEIAAGMFRLAWPETPFTHSHGM
jgi:hypothetical protein